MRASILILLAAALRSAAAAGSDLLFGGSDSGDDNGGDDLFESFETKEELPELTDSAQFTGHQQSSSNKRNGTVERV